MRKTVSGAKAADDPRKLARFANAQLTSVTVWLYGVSMGFNDVDMGINIEGQVEIQAGGASERYDMDQRVALGKRLLDLLERRILTIGVVDRDLFLSVKFEGDVTLTVRPDQSGYEAFVLYLPDGSTLVG